MQKPPLDSSDLPKYNSLVEPEKIHASRIEIQPPSIALRDSYVENLREMADQDPGRASGIRWDLLEDFEKYLELCKKQSELTEAVDGAFPALTYWIVLDRSVAVGKLTLHPVLTPRLRVLGGHFGYEVRPSYRRHGIAEIACSQGLKMLKQRGFTEVFSTCDEDNIGSRRVLEKNGGILVDRYTLPDWPKPVLKFEFALN